jgi:hypothetical protein
MLLVDLLLPADPPLRLCGGHHRLVSFVLTHARGSQARDDSSLRWEGPRIVPFVSVFFREHAADFRQFPLVSASFR